MKNIKRSLFATLIFVLITVSGCTFEGNDSKKSNYVSFVTSFGPNNDYNNSYYHYVKNEDGFIYSKISKYDIKSSKEHEVFALDNNTAGNKRITDYYGNDNDLFIIVNENKNDNETSFLYHHNNNSGENQIITEVSGSIYLIRTGTGIIVGINKKDDNDTPHYYNLDEANSTFQLSEIVKPELNNLNNYGSSEIIPLENGKSVTFTKNIGEANYSYSLDGINGDIDALTNKNALDSGLYNDFLVEDEKVIGAVQFTEWKNGLCPKNLLKPQNLKGAALFEFDINTQKSNILYETKGSDTLIIGYKDKQVYLYRKGKVIRKSLNDKKEKIIYSVDKNKNKDQLSFNWINNTLLIFDEDDYTVIGSCND